MMNQLKDDLRKYIIYFSIIVLIIVCLIVINDPYTKEVCDEIDTVMILNKNEINIKKCRFIKNENVSMILDKEGYSRISSKAFKTIKLKTIENGGNALVVKYVNNVDNFTIGHQSLLYSLTRDYININIYFCNNKMISNKKERIK